jgi:hypothetical protein
VRELEWRQTELDVTDEMWEAIEGNSWLVTLNMDPVPGPRPTDTTDEADRAREQKEIEMRARLKAHLERNKVLQDRTRAAAKTLIPLVRGLFPAGPLDPTLPPDASPWLRLPGELKLEVLDWLAEGDLSARQIQKIIAAADELPFLPPLPYWDVRDLLRKLDCYRWEARS